MVGEHPSDFTMCRCNIATYKKTYQKVINIVNNKLNMKEVSTLTVDDINRSHVIGPIKEGKAQIIGGMFSYHIVPGLQFYSTVY
jgi:hypothetical protein